MNFKKVTDYEVGLSDFILEFYPKEMLEMGWRDDIPQKIEDEYIKGILDTGTLHLSLLKWFAKVVPVKIDEVDWKNKMVFNVTFDDDAIVYVYRSVWFDANNWMIVEFIEQINSYDDLEMIKRKMKERKQGIKFILDNHDKITGYGDAKITWEAMIEQFSKMYVEIEKILSTEE